MYLFKVGILVDNKGVTSEKTVIAIANSGDEAIEHAKDIFPYGYHYGILESGKAITID